MPNARRSQDFPPNYSASYESVVRLSDGRRVEIRPILPSDAPELAEAIRTADPETLRARFLGGPPQLSEAVLDKLTRGDYGNRLALGPRGGGRAVGVARSRTLPPTDGSLVADVAVAVAPEWRRVGLATALIELLARRAQECGITEFTALFLAENRPVTELAHEGHARMVIAEGVAQLHAALTTPPQDWPSHNRSE